MKNTFIRDASSYIPSCTHKSSASRNSMLSGCSKEYNTQLVEQLNDFEVFVNSSVSRNHCKGTEKLANFSRHHISGFSLLQQQQQTPLTESFSTPSPREQRIADRVGGRRRSRKRGREDVESVF